MNENLDKNSTVAASDHRLERWIESTGFNTSKDETYNLWIAEDVSECIDELLGFGKNYSRITHVVIDDIMFNEVVHIGIRSEGVVSVFMTDESYNKFTQQPFELIYTEESFNLDTDERLRWTEVYQINWSYIDNSDIFNI